MHVRFEKTSHTHYTLVCQRTDAPARQAPYSPIDCDFHDELEAAATIAKVSEIVVRDTDGKLLTIRDMIVDLGHLDPNDKAAEYMALRNGKRYRLDRIVSIDGKTR